MSPFDSRGLNSQAYQHLITGYIGINETVSKGVIKSYDTRIENQNVVLVSSRVTLASEYTIQ